MALPAWVWVAAELGVFLLLSDGPAAPGGVSSAMNNVPNLPDSFWVALWGVATRLGADPRVLGLLLYEESGIDPRAQNSQNLAVACVGINQFCPGTYEYFVPMAPSAYLALSAEEQLPFVAKYWASKPAAGLASTRDLFWLSLTPVTWVENATPETVVNDPVKLGAALAADVAKWNPSVAIGGVITAGSIDAYLARKAQEPGWLLALDKIAASDPSGDNVA